MSMASIQMANIMVTMIYNWNESMSTIQKQMVTNMYPAPFWWTWSQVPWTRYDRHHMERYSGQITLYLVNQELVCIILSNAIKAIVAECENVFLIAFDIFDLFFLKVITGQKDIIPKVPS